MNNFGIPIKVAKEHWKWLMQKGIISSSEEKGLESRIMEKRTDSPG